MTAFHPTEATEMKKLIAWHTTRQLGALEKGLHPFDAAYDELGNVICYSEYGKHSSPYGWEIDHRHAKSLGGSDHPSNLRALSCKINRGLGGLIGAMLRNL